MCASQGTGGVIENERADEAAGEATQLNQDGLAHMFNSILRVSAVDSKLCSFSMNVVGACMERE